MEDESLYMSPSKLAKRWAVSVSSIYHFKCGTEKLTRIYLGKTLRFLTKEIETLEGELYTQAQRYRALPRLETT